MSRRDRQAWDKDWGWKALEAGQCFPESVLETEQGFGRCCQEMPHQDVSSSALPTDRTNRAPLCSVSYLATAPLQCGPLPQARIKLRFPRPNSLQKNHLGVIPVWSQPPYSSTHCISCHKCYAKQACTLAIYRSPSSINVAKWRDCTRFKLRGIMRSAYFREAPWEDINQFRLETRRYIGLQNIQMLAHSVT